MSRKKIYAVQVDVSATLGAVNAYLPYTVGILIASAFSDSVVAENFGFGGFVFLREEPSEVARRLDAPAVVLFSNYCWNTEYNKKLACEIKKLYPDCITVFGGHNIPADNSFFDECPDADILSHGEGEQTTRLLLRAIAEGTSLADVPNLSLRTENGYLRTANKLQEGLDYPSPYLEGWFDSIVEQHPEITFNAILETSRGCPNKCAYCDWGRLKSKVRLFPLERVKAEIEWFSAHKIAFVWGADANFGMFPRDYEIACALVDAKKKNGYPERMRMNYAKNNFENVFAIVKKFKECEVDRIGATLSFQSLSPEVLENIGRTNADTDFCRGLLTRYNTEKMKAYSELILGLPGETYESFIKGIATLFEIGQHFVFDVYSCIMLPNAQLGQKEIIEKFGLETVKTEIVRPHFVGSDFDIPEYNRIITQTASMPRDKWVRSLLFYYITKTFHGNGLLRAFAIYLRYEMNVPYEKFYDGLLDYIENTPTALLSSVFAEIRGHIEEQSLGQGNRKLIFPPAGDIVWDDHEYAVLRLLNEPDLFFEEITPYLASFGISADVFDDLMKYQRAILRRPCDERQEIRLEYDIHGFLTDVYVNRIHPLERLSHTLVMTDTDTQPDWVKFGKFVVWYGRMGWASYKDDIKKERGL